MGKIFFLVALLCSSHVLAKESTCYGKTHAGSLKNGVKLPSKGKNFVAYSDIANALGRTYVHSRVKQVVVHAYRSLAKSAPNKVFKYAETGFKQGGPFKPHKTHQNGLSIDFMVPVLNKQGQSVHLPTHAFNKWGYNIEFDKLGRYKSWRIDFEALAAHLVSLHKAAKKYNIGIRRVIFDPKLQPYLMQTRFSAYLKAHITFSKRRSWVRHDEHYHVDFRVRCKTQ